MQEGYEAALACDGEQCDGQTLKVQKCKWSPKERAARLRQQQQQQAALQPPQHQAPPLQQQEQRHEQPQGRGSNGYASPALQQQQAEGAGQRQHNNNPAPKTEGYNVAYVGEYICLNGLVVGARLCSLHCSFICIARPSHLGWPMGPRVKYLHASCAPPQ